MGNSVRRLYPVEAALTYIYIWMVTISLISWNMQGSPPWKALLRNVLHCFTSRFGMNRALNWHHTSFCKLTVILFVFISTKSALRRPLTYDNHPSTFCSEWTKQTLGGTKTTSDELRWTEMNYKEQRQKPVLHTSLDDLVPVLVFHNVVCCSN